MASHSVRLPKDALSRINLGQSFAEYDRLLMRPGVFVQTPAIAAATDPDRGKCFFVGRRGTGKTAITYFIREREKRSILLLPQVFSPLGLTFDVEKFRDTRQRHFRSLVSCFKRALQDEILDEWNTSGLLPFERYTKELGRERNFIEDFDFDGRVLRFFETMLDAINRNSERDWTRELGRHKDLADEMRKIAVTREHHYPVLIDRIDDSWDGSDQAVIILMALMHACVELSGLHACLRPLLFLRENIFERVRAIDNEFARLETAVVGLDWTHEQLLELIERRLNLPFNTKLPVRGPTWDYFFESVQGHSSRDYVFEFCQERPRDVLIYCSFAVESAQSRRHEFVSIEDLQAARRRFSDSRLKDLGDEYSENYPQLQMVLNRFYGLGHTFTVTGIAAFIKKLLLDQTLMEICGSWLFNVTTPDRFIELFYNIGFFGIVEGDSVAYRSLGPMSSTPPAITANTQIQIHPSYRDALNLQSLLVTALENVQLQQEGLVGEVPEALDLSAYHEQLALLSDRLKACPLGDSGAAEFESIIGEVVRLCFFASLTNVAPKERDVDSRVIRDWVAANHAALGFWEMVRQRYLAVQVVWECKNYEELEASDFHQASYYMTREGGRFAVLCFRGEVKRHYYQHIRRIASEKDGGVVLLLTPADLQVFIRQARNGKSKEDHIRELYDKTIRAIS